MDEHPHYFGKPPKSYDAVLAFLAKLPRRVLELARFAGAAVDTWARVAARVAPLWFEGVRLRRRRSRLQYALGDAAYTQDERRMGELRAELSNCLASRDDCARRSRAAVGRARARTRAERRAVAVTRVREPQG